jgi:small subunit ribosomal protein S20
MADPKKAEVKKVKQPTALKRDLQSQRLNIRNRAYKAKVNTAMRSLKESIEKKDQSTLKANLDAMYSLMDKGVKTGIYKANKAGRVKSRLTKLATSSKA